MKVLFYSLHAAIWAHALPENRLVRELTARGCEVVYVSCGRTFPEHCTSYSAFRVDDNAPQAQKDKICRNCLKNASILVRASGARHLQLRNYVTREDEARVEVLLQDVTPDNYFDFRFEGIDVGRAAAYEPFLLFKKMSLVLTQDEWNYYRIYLRNCLLSLVGFSRLYEEEHPDTIFFYSPQYGVNGVCAQFASQRGCRVYFIEGSSNNAERYKALRVWDWSEHGLVNPALRHWARVKDRVVAEDIRRVTGHFEELLHAKSFAVYSEPVTYKFSLRAHFGIPAAAKTVLLTLSSYDEAYAAFVIGKFPDRKVKSPVFCDQFEWVKATVKHVTGRDDIYLIIRVHPRDYPNKRDDRTSEQAAFWDKLFESRPSNVIVNWPQDRISLYDILREVDVVATGWSATGVEALAFGVPVVTYDRFLPSYPADIHFTGESEEEYYANIQRAINKGRGLDHVMGVYRWLAVSFSMGTVRILPPVAVGANWPPKLILRMLRKAITIAFGNMIRLWDARRRIDSKTDADRFYTLVTEGSASLYDVVEKTLPDDSHSDIYSVREIISSELDRFSKPSQPA